VSYQDIAWHWFVRSGHPDLYVQYKNFGIGECCATNEVADARAYGQVNVNGLKLSNVPRVMDARVRA